MLIDIQIDKKKLELKYDIDPSILKSMQESTRKSI